MCEDTNRGAWSYEVITTSCRCWQLNFSSPEEKQFLLTPGSCLQPPRYFLLLLCVCYSILFYFVIIVCLCHGLELSKEKDVPISE